VKAVLLVKPMAHALTGATVGSDSVANRVGKKVMSLPIVIQASLPLVVYA